MNLFLLNASSSGASSGAKTGGTLDMIVMLLPMVLIFGVMWFVMIRPQRKKQKEEAHNPFAVQFEEDESKNKKKKQPTETKRL